MEFIIRNEDERAMWKKFLITLSSLSKTKGLTDREADIVAYVFTCPSSVKEPLRGVSRKQLKHMLGMKEQTLSMHKSNIEEKGYLVDGKLSPSLYKFREEYEKKGSLKLDLNFVI